MAFVWIVRIIFCVAFMAFLLVAVGERNEKTKNHFLIATVLMGMLIFYTIFLGDLVR